MLTRNEYLQILEELGLTYRIEPNENIVIYRNHELILTCVFFGSEHNELIILYQYGDRPLTC